VTINYTDADGAEHRQKGGRTFLNWSERENTLYHDWKARMSAQRVQFLRWREFQEQNEDEVEEEQKEILARFLQVVRLLELHWEFEVEEEEQNEDGRSHSFMDNLGYLILKSHV
jgi:hypothetical protein